MLSIGRLSAGERVEWERLFRGYIDFYERTEQQAMYDRAWNEFQDDDRMHALGATLDGSLVGIVHYLVHASTTSGDVCYLQDLYVDPQTRGRGIARALISAVADEAAARDCDRVYWTTKTTNTVARRLYDQMAEDRGFMVYRIPLAER